MTAVLATFQSAVFSLVSIILIQSNISATMLNFLSELLPLSCSELYRLYDVDRYEKANADRVRDYND